MSITTFLTGAGAKDSVFSSCTCTGVFRACWLVCSLGWEPVWLGTKSLEILLKRIWKTERERRYKPWSEQKKPWRHLEQESFVAALACGDEVGTVTGCLGAGLARTGFSVVCLPVLHLYLQETNKKYQCVSLRSTTTQRRTWGYYTWWGCYLLPRDFQEQSEIVTSLLAAAPFFHSVMEKRLHVWIFLALTLRGDECNKIITRVNLTYSLLGVDSKKPSQARPEKKVW